MAYDGYPEGYAANLRRELEAAEPVLWEGRPVRRGFRFRLGPSSCMGVPFLAFSLFWTGMAFYMTSQVPAGDDLGGAMRYIFPLFGVPFIVVGFGLCFGPSIVATAGLRNAEYLVTDKRVLVRGGASKITITQAPLTDVTSVTSSGGAVGSLTLYFASPPASRMADGTPATNTENTLVFESIPNPSQVRVLVEDAVRRAKESKAK
ncbi:MAG: PH domain-containing protein [Armatimonadetes bacterium]|nr:PH domain-containing protein [Armatimonadota bacterium]